MGGVGGAESFYCQTQPLLRLGWGFDNKIILLINMIAAPHDPTSEECGFPLLCSLYGLLVFIVLLVIYKTVVGVRD